MADEVRKLAEQSKSSVNSIIDVIANIQNNTEDVEQAVGVIVRNVNEGVQITHYAETAFAEIMRTIEELTGQIED